MNKMPTNQTLLWAVVFATLFLLLFSSNAEAIDRDNFTRAGFGYGIALTCNTAIDAILDKNPNSLNHNPNQLEQIMVCTLTTFAIGGFYEALRAGRDQKTDPNNILATGIGGASAGLIRLVIDF